MASILKVDGRWRAQIRRAGHKSIAKSFATKVEAEKWSRQTERDMDASEYLDGRTNKTFANLCDRYKDEIEVGRSAENVIKHLRFGLGDLAFDKLDSLEICKYIKLRGYGPSTATVELSVLGTILKVARVVWKLPIRDGIAQDARQSLTMIGKVAKSGSRDRRPTQDELDRLCAYFDIHSALPMRDVINFAIVTAMRAGEIDSLLWADYNSVDKTVMIRDRKHPSEKIGNNQTVPLLAQAIEIIERQPKSGLHIFTHKSDTVSSIFPRACKKLGIIDLRFHDLRHEGVSRLFELGYQIQEVALFSGHRDWAMLKRYTQIRAKDLRRL